MAGHASALADAGILHPPELTRAGEPTVRFGHQAAGELLDLPQRPTALVGFNDKTAVGALAAAAERGLRVSEDLSITGFDDIDLAQATSPGPAAATRAFGIVTATFAMVALIAAAGAHRATRTPAGQILAGGGA